MRKKPDKIVRSEYATPQIDPLQEIKLINTKTPKAVPKRGFLAGLGRMLRKRKLERQRTREKDRKIQEEWNKKKQNDAIKVRQAQDKIIREKEALIVQGAAIPGFVAACKAKGVNPETTFRNAYKVLSKHRPLIEMEERLEVEARLAGKPFSEASFWASAIVNALNKKQ